MDFELTEDNLFIYAAKHYYNPKYIDAEEFQEDLKRFKYIKRLLNRYEETGKLSERLILNHLIVVFNVFGIGAGLKILELKLDTNHWPLIKPFLIFLRYIRNDQYTNIPMDQTVVDALRKI
jgi:glutamate mutase epsilon subunit